MTLKLVRLACLVLCFSAWVARAETPTVEELWEIIQQQQKTINELKQKLELTDKKVEVADQKAEIVTKQLDMAVEATEATGDDDDDYGEIDIGGYGELHYNALTDDNDTVGGDDDLNRLDFHRFVLEFGYDFSDTIRLSSELEVEHTLAGEDAPGEVKVEQAWLEIDINDNHRFRTGIDILPIGLISINHEPNTFYGVERNQVETEVIPSAWGEAGLGFNGEIAPGWNYRTFAHGGLISPNSGASTLRPRSGRSQVAQAEDQDIALTGQVRYTKIPGLEVALAGHYQADMTGTKDDYKVDATLLESHVDYKHSSGLALRAFYARWDIDAPAGIAFAQDHLDGWYIEPAYRFTPGMILGELGFFMRYAEWDAIGGEGSTVPDGEYVNYDMFNIGMNWWPHPSVVFKVDYQNEGGDSRARAIRDGINVGFGFSF